MIDLGVQARMMSRCRRCLLLFYLMVCHGHDAAGHLVSPPPNDSKRRPAAGLPSPRSAKTRNLGLVREHASKPSQANHCSVMCARLSLSLSSGVCPVASSPKIQVPAGRSPVAPLRQLESDLERHACLLCRLCCEEDALDSPAGQQDC